MNWFKKLVTFVSREEEDEEITEQPMPPIQNHTQAKLDEPSSYKNVEAKVSYQYPKGNFRFPVIPDEKIILRHERPRTRKPRETYQNKETTATYTSKQNKPVKEEKEELKPRKPFQPTSIPSPVHGFQKRKPRQTKLEELKDSKVENFETTRNLTESSMTNQTQSHRSLQIEDASIPVHDEIAYTKDREHLKAVTADESHDFKITNWSSRLEETEIEHEYSNDDELPVVTFFNEKPEQDSSTSYLDILTENQEAQEKVHPINHLSEEPHHQELGNQFEQEETSELEFDSRVGNIKPEWAIDDDVQLETDLTVHIEQATDEELDTKIPVQKVADVQQEIYQTEQVEEATDEEVLDSALRHLITGQIDEPDEEQLFAADTAEQCKHDYQEQFEAKTTREIEHTEDELPGHSQQEQDIRQYNVQDETVTNLSEQSHQLESEPQQSVAAVNQEDTTIKDKHEQDQINSQQQRKKSLPFNVMMLGRDKQRMREKAENGYQFPLLNYLNVPEREFVEDDTWLTEQTALLNSTLHNFNVRANVVNVTQGPSVTRFEVHPEPGVKVNKITNLSDDIKLSLSARDIRIEAPIPGKNTIGIEVPNKVSKMVYLREIVRSTEFRANKSPMTAVLGLDISGQPVVTDLKKMPHGLIAGATGSGKSVCINTILVSLLYKAKPEEVKLMLIDPKMVELAPYNNIPHLVSPVITDVKAATAALKWAVEEMERRYELFAHSGTREITRYNQLVNEHKQGEHLPYLVIVIDELADLMMVAPNDVEEAICRIAQKARACGIHLIVATQRPSVDVITGLIKANVPTRIAFSVSSQVDSRTIIDVAGAEKLLGKGDMLFLENGSSKAVRLQGTFVSDEEIERVVAHVRKQAKPQYLFHQEELVKKATIQSEEDELFVEACEFVVNQGGASTSLLQRHFRIGYNRAARLIDMMEEQGIVSETKGSKPRDILISEEELEVIHGD
ncbi:DNA translocase FtsK [Metabacillus malikii]|uniref:S-DNA-T family DNA segregation ATPase FtsK/SpoIIIE n=1 Tax=Metabacillus malikii TaxID=1504265 RepID=A0ABT9ZQ25_9BACI|nr:DNA translocase FtsK [Metabacillus malikii]MDQ0233598.1 S-DNA-T family DNA segregation ATPase FtsK/SpoIIIE [Metabacillus malikii]